VDCLERDHPERLVVFGGNLDHIRVMVRVAVVALALEIRVEQIGLWRSIQLRIFECTLTDGHISWLTAMLGKPYGTLNAVDYHRQAFLVEP